MVSSTTEAPFAQSRETRAAAADTASDAKDWPQAIALWDGLRADFPENARYWHKTGEAYCHAGMLEQADRILDEAIALFPDDEWAAYWSIVVARRKPDWPEALRRAEKMGRAFPDSWRPMVEAAEALAAVQRLVESEEIRREAVKRFPDEFWTHFGVARLEAERSDPPGAVRIWTELAERFPNEPTAAEALQAAREAARHPLRQRSPGLPGAPSLAGDETRPSGPPAGQSRGFPWRRRGRVR
jgi:tetratricopeptide (TPR) repeat protein